MTLERAGARRHLPRGRWFALTMLLLIAVLLPACGSAGGDADTGGRTAVIATTTQIADMATNVAGDRASVHSLLPANADAHDFEPTPRDIERVHEADLVLVHGLGFDTWVENMIADAGGAERVITVTGGIPTIEGAHDTHAGDHDHGAVDPHVWLDVANAKLMVERIRDAFVAADPAGAADYEANAARYLRELDDLDAWIRQQIVTIPIADRKLVTNHDAFGYYVNAYGLEFVGSIIPSLDSQAQPSAQDTAALIDKIQAEGVKAIFTEAAISSDLARQLADEAGVVVVDDLYGDSLGDDDSGASTYIEMMRWNTTKIVEALR